MKTLIILIMAFSFSFSAQASLTDGTLKDRMSSMLDYADAMEKGSFSQASTYLTVVESLADSNIDDLELIKRVALKVDALKETYSAKQNRLLRRRLQLINSRIQ